MDQRRADGSAQQPTNQHRIHAHRYQRTTTSPSEHHGHRPIGACPQPETEPTSQFTLGQRRVIYLATFLIGVVTVVAAPVVTAIQAPAWIPALISGLCSAAATISSAFGWRYLGK